MNSTRQRTIRITRRGFGSLAGALALAAAASAVVAPGSRAAYQLSWSPPVLIDGSGHSPSAISCPSESLCVAVDSGGNALTSIDPTAAAPVWSSGQINSGQPLNAVSCASATLCVAVGSGGEASTSTNPSAGASSWSHAMIDTTKATLTGVSCPSPSLCVAVAESGRVLTTATPSSPSSWIAAEIDTPANRLQSVSCASETACVAVDRAGSAFGSQNPSGGLGAWHGRAIDSGIALPAVSCAPAGVCAAVATSGDALASANASSPASTWISTPIDAGGHPLAVSCAESGLCVAVDDRGEALASDNPSAALPIWSGSAADLGAGLAGVACLGGGLCLAIDTAGRFASGRVPAPEAFTAAPAQVTETTASLSGVVNPYDAILGACTFEYGTTTAYGSSVSCAGLPVPAGGAQLVGATLVGLSPNATYHYRLLASSFGGVGVGLDRTFTTAASSLVPLVVPHPSIRGTPAVGSRLSCQSGTPSGAAQLSFAWLRDLIPIPRATSSSYAVVGADSGHHLQCQVTATNAGGSSTARSAFVTIPIQGVVAAAGETAVGMGRISKGRLSVPIRCSAQAFSGCRILIRLTAVTPTTVALGAARARLARGEHRSVLVSLNALGRRLLKSHQRRSVQLTVTGTVIGVLESVLSQQRLSIGAGARRAATHVSAHGS